MQKISLPFLLFFILCFMFAVTSIHAQSDSSKKKVVGDHIWNIDALVAIDFPMANMAKRFGTSYRIGFGIKNKTKSNWIYGAKVEFITGKNIKEDSLLYGVTTAQGGIIGATGELLNVGIFERGYMIGLQVGRIFPFGMLNKNSGPMLLCSAGFMQHKIKLFDRDIIFPQLTGEYLKGYDRLTNGWFMEEFIGYNYFSTNKLINCYAGISFVQGFTKGRRDFLYDVKRPDNEGRADLLIGFKLGWVIPLYKRNVEETYY